MSGDWIKMRVDLGDDPAVYAIAAATKLTRLDVVGRLWAFWAWADRYSADGTIPHATSAVIDDICQKRGFAAALAAVGWLNLGEGETAVPRFDSHNGKSAKARAEDAKRKQRERTSGVRASISASERRPANNGQSSDNSPQSVQKNLDTSRTREEKRREDITPGFSTPPELAPVDNFTPDGDKSPESQRPKLSLPKDWTKSNDGIDACGRMLGIHPQPGEPYPAYKDRLSKALYEHGRQAA